VLVVASTLFRFMRIAVDVMGSDHGPGVVIGGVKQALRSYATITALFLVGRHDEIEAGLKHAGLRDSRIEIVDAREVLTMEDRPIAALRRKKDCSIARAVDLVKHGRADAVVSPGNTGGIVAASTLKLRTLAGIDRPAIATVIPSAEGEFVLLDSGASIGCRPVHLLQFAIMGHVYAREILGHERPRVGILSVGTEANKGNDLTLEAHRLCQQTNLNFIGNVEGHDLFKNRVDVVVCDGFVGNIVLKTCESLARGILTWLKAELTRNPARMFGAWLARNAFRSVKKRLDPDVYGGAPLLGLNGTVMKAHGSARETAIMNAIRVATASVHHQINQQIAAQVATSSRALGVSPESLSPPAST
jgi:glycerol-3-phosphate acyltransferase PlsX